MNLITQIALYNGSNFLLAEIQNWFPQKKYRKDVNASLAFSFALAPAALLMIAIQTTKIVMFVTCASGNCPIELTRTIELLDAVSWLIPFYHFTVYFLLDPDWNTAFKSRLPSTLQCSHSLTKIDAAAYI